MAHRLAPTLSEVRQAVAIRVKKSQAAQAPDIRAQLDESIRAAFADILTDADHLVLRGRAETSLIDKQHRYDLPDGFDRAGNWDSVFVVDTNENEYELHSGLRPFERNMWRQPAEDDEGNQADRSGLPLRYELMDGYLDIYPAPKVELYPTLVVEGFREPPEPVRNDDRIEVHKEALVRLATFYAAKNFGQRDADTWLAMYGSLRDSLRAGQSEGETIRIGGHFSRKFPYSRRRETPTAGDVTRYPNWTPDV